jgi:hypothetical protein
MDWPSYVQRMLYGGGNQPAFLSGGYAGPMMLAALQRFIVENSYAINMAQQGAAIMQDVAAQQAEQQAATLGSIPLLGGLAGSAAGAQTMANATAAGNDMIALAGGNPSAGWGPMRDTMTGSSTYVAPVSAAGWDPLREATNG